MRNRIVLLFVALAALSTQASGSAESSSTAPLKFEPKAHYRFNLGGDSGQYTDWEQSDLDSFDGLTTTIQIDKAYGKPTDKWSSLARLNLFGAGDAKNRQVISLLFEVDRHDNHVIAALYRGKDKPHETFDAQVPFGKPFVVTVVRNEPGSLLVSIGKATYTVPCDMDIKGIGAVGSGVDVKFEPFELLRAKS